MTVRTLDQQFNMYTQRSSQN